MDWLVVDNMYVAPRGGGQADMIFLVTTALRWVIMIISVAKMDWLAICMLHLDKVVKQMWAEGLVIDMYVD